MRKNQGSSSHKRISAEIDPGNANDFGRDNNMRRSKRIRKSSQNSHDYIYEDSFGYELLADETFDSHLLGMNSLKDNLMEKDVKEDTSYEDNSCDVNSSDDSFVDSDFPENESIDGTSIQRESANHYEKSEKKKAVRKVVAKDKKERAPQKTERRHLGEIFNFNALQWVPYNVVVSRKGTVGVGKVIPPLPKSLKETPRISNFSTEKRPSDSKIQALPSPSVPARLNTPRLHNTDMPMDAIILELNDPEVKFSGSLEVATDKVASDSKIQALPSPSVPARLNTPRLHNTDMPMDAIILELNDPEVKFSGSLEVATDKVAEVQEDDRERVSEGQDLMKSSSEDIKDDLIWLDLNVSFPDAEEITDPSSESEDLADFIYVPREEGDLPKEHVDHKGPSTELERPSYPPAIEFPPSNPSSTSEFEAVQ